MPQPLLVEPGAQQRAGHVRTEHSRTRTGVPCCERGQHEPVFALQNHTRVHTRRRALRVYTTLLLATSGRGQHEGLSVCTHLCVHLRRVCTTSSVRRKEPEPRVREAGRPRGPPRPPLGFAPSDPSRPFPRLFCRCRIVTMGPLVWSRSPLLAGPPPRGAPTGQGGHRPAAEPSPSPA